jgi:hypothetical protein
MSILSVSLHLHSVSWFDHQCKVQYTGTWRPITTDTYHCMQWQCNTKYTHHTTRSPITQHKQQHRKLDFTGLWICRTTVLQTVQHAYGNMLSFIVVMVIRMSIWVHLHWLQQVKLHCLKPVVNFKNGMEKTTIFVIPVGSYMRQSLAPHCTVPGSIPGQFMWDL